MRPNKNNPVSADAAKSDNRIDGIQRNRTPSQYDVPTVSQADDTVIISLPPATRPIGLDIVIKQTPASASQHTVASIDLDLDQKPAIAKETPVALPSSTLLDTLPAKEKPKGTSKLLARLSFATLIIGVVISYSVWIYNLTMANIYAIPEKTGNHSISSTDNPPSERPITTQQFLNHTVPINKPRYLRMPSIGTQAIIYDVGLDRYGAVGIPDNIYATGWYNGSAQATDVAGAMLMVGHYSGRTRAKGIFGKIEQLKKGHILEVESGGGSVRKFKVVQLKSYPINKVDMVAALTSADTGKLGLNLMTCGGTYDQEIQTYDHRTLVRAIAIK